MTQEALAEKTGVKFQQIQKYELGHNRVSASRLKMIADALGLHPAFFFDENFVGNTNGDALIDALTGASSATGRMIQIFPRLKPEVQEQLIQLAKSFSGASGSVDRETEQAGADDSPKD